MNNTQLSRQVDIAKRLFEVIIDDLVSEVEELEGDKDKMQDEIDSLEATIEKMAERISELEAQITG
jgi:peptidoglycan hydrolase CwlO-like protein